MEVIVNGPKTWSVAASIHPEISAAYDRAQDRAAKEIVGWLAANATTRIGPRGRQVQVTVDQIEAAVIRHFTSRAGDPHRHLHVQINARVFAQGRWRGLHSAGVVDSIEALNGTLFDADYQLMLGQTSYSAEREEALLEAIIGRRPDGIFLTGLLPPGKSRSMLLASGIPVVESESQAEGVGLLGDFAKAVLWDREQTTVTMTDSHADFFIRNLVAILAEERLAFGVTRPTAFVSLDLTA